MSEDIDLAQLHAELRFESARNDAETQVEAATTLLILFGIVVAVWGVSKLIHWLEE